MSTEPGRRALSLATVLVSAAIGLFAISGAQAGGSIAFTDVRSLAASDAKLTAAIDSLVAASPGAAAGAVCNAQRLGRQWVHLGGDRIPPFECRIGKKIIEIDARVLFFDHNEKLVGATAGTGPGIGDVTFASAARWRMDAPTWTIKDSE